MNGVVSILKSSTLAEMEGRARLEEDVKVKASSKRDVIDVGAGMNFAGANSGGLTVMLLIAGDKMDQDAADQLTYGNSNGNTTKTFDSTALVNHLQEKGMDVSSLEHLEEDLESSGQSIDTNNLGSTDKDGNVQFDASSGVNAQSTEDEDDDKTDETDDVKNARDVGYKIQNGKKRTLVPRHVTGFLVVNSQTQEEIGVYETAAKAQRVMQDLVKNQGIATTMEYVDRTVFDEVWVDLDDTNHSAYDDDPMDDVNARIGSNAVITANAVSVNAEQETLADLFAASVNASGELTGGISFAAAKLRSNVLATSLGTITVTGGGSVEVKAESKSGEAEMKKDSDEELRQLAVVKGLKDSLNPTNRSIRAVGLVASIAGEMGFAISAGAVRLDNVTKSTLGGTVKNARKVNVDAEAKYSDILATTIALAATGEASIAASIAAVVAQGDVSAKVIDGATISDEKKNTYTDDERKDGEINVTTDTIINADTVAAAVAASGGGAVVAGLALTVNNLTQNTAIERGATIDLADVYNSRLNVKSKSATTANALLMGASGGYVGVNMGVAIAKVNPTVHTTVGVDGDENKKTTINNVSEMTVNNDVTSAAHSDVLTATAGGVAVGGNVLLVYNDTDALAKVAAVTGNIRKKTVISGTLDAVGASEVSAIVVGGVTVGLTVSYVDVNANNTADLDATDFDLKAGELYVIAGRPVDEAAYNKAVKNGKEESFFNTKAVAKAFTADVGLINIGVNVALARNRVQNNAYRGQTGSAQLRHGLCQRRSPRHQ